MAENDTESPVAEEPKNEAKQKMQRHKTFHHEINFDHIDYHHRDPHHLNENLRLEFGDIIGEPEPGTFSADKVWEYSFKGFALTKLWCYRVLTYICAIPAAVCWGVCFACLSFANIWCCNPAVRSCRIQTTCIKQVFNLIVNMFLVPLFTACGYTLSKINVAYTNGKPISPANAMRDEYEVEQFNHRPKRDDFENVDI